MSPIKLTSTIALMLALTGCSGASSDPTASTDSPAVAAAAGVSLAEGWTKPDACAVIDKAAYGQTVGQAVTGSELLAAHASDGTTAATSECKMTMADGSHNSILLRWSPINDNDEGAINTLRSGLRQVAEAFGGTMETVPDLGKAAFWVDKTGSLNVFIGEDRLAIINVPTGPAAREQAITVAKSLGA